MANPQQAVAQGSKDLEKITGGKVASNLLLSQIGKKAGNRDNAQFYRDKMMQELKAMELKYDSKALDDKKKALDTAKDAMSKIDPDQLRRLVLDAYNKGDVASAMLMLDIAAEGKGTNFKDYRDSRIARQDFHRAREGDASRLEIFQGAGRPGAEAFELILPPELVADTARATQAGRAPTAGESKQALFNNALSFIAEQEGTTPAQLANAAATMAGGELDPTTNESDYKMAVLSQAQELYKDDPEAFKEFFETFTAGANVAKVMEARTQAGIADRMAMLAKDIDAIPDIDPLLANQLKAQILGMKESEIVKKYAETGQTLDLLAVLNEAFNELESKATTPQEKGDIRNLRPIAVQNLITGRGVGTQSGSGGAGGVDWLTQYQAGSPNADLLFRVGAAKGMPEHILESNRKYAQQLLGGRDFASMSEEDRLQVGNGLKVFLDQGVGAGGEVVQRYSLSANMIRYQIPRLRQLFRKIRDKSGITLHYTEGFLNRFGYTGSDPNVHTFVAEMNNLIEAALRLRSGAAIHQWEEEKFNALFPTIKNTARLNDIKFNALESFVNQYMEQESVGALGNQWGKYAVAAWKRGNEQSKLNPPSQAIADLRQRGYDDAKIAAFIQQKYGLAQNAIEQLMAGE